MRAGEKLLRLVLPALFLALVQGACHFRSAPREPAPKEPVQEGVDDLAQCVLCHEPAAAAYSLSLHSRKGIQCEQCHKMAGHPDFEVPVTDATCASCHSAQFEQTLRSAHFKSRKVLDLDGDPALRAELRESTSFLYVEGGERLFVGDAQAGDLGGRLCAGCHYDGHSFQLDDLRQGRFCLQCHSRLKDHYSVAGGASDSACIACHVRVGETTTGQPVNNHSFATLAD